MLKLLLLIAVAISSAPLALGAPVDDNSDFLEYFAHLEATAPRECPLIHAKAASECAAAGQSSSSSCWSPGEEDVDCAANDYCCFDGCANHCRYNARLEMVFK